MATCLTVSGLGLLILAFAACVVSFLAPFWHRNTYLNEEYGLWGQCNRDGRCRWWFEEDFAWEKNTPTWHRCSQAFFTMGIVLFLVTFFLIIFNLCCQTCCKRPTATKTFGLLLVINAFLIIIAIAIYGIKLHLEEDIGRTGIRVWNWAFYIGIAGGVLTALSGIFFLIAGCKGGPGQGYSQAGVV